MHFFLFDICRILCRSAASSPTSKKAPRRVHFTPSPPSTRLLLSAPTLLSFRLNGTLELGREAERRRRKGVRASLQLRFQPPQPPSMPHLQNRSCRREPNWEGKEVRKWRPSCLFCLLRRRSKKYKRLCCWALHPV